MTIDTPSRGVKWKSLSREYVPLRAEPVGHRQPFGTGSYNTKTKLFSQSLAPEFLQEYVDQMLDI